MRSANWPTVSSPGAGVALVAVPIPDVTVIEISGVEDGVGVRFGGLSLPQPARAIAQAARTTLQLRRSKMLQVTTTPTTHKTGLRARGVRTWSRPGKPT